MRGRAADWNSGPDGCREASYGFSFVGHGRIVAAASDRGLQSRLPCLCLRNAGYVHTHGHPDVCPNPDAEVVQMTRISRSIFLFAIVTVVFGGGTATAEEPKDKPQPELIQAKQPAIQAFKQQRIFGSLLQKGQTVTLYQLRQEAPTSYQYQVRIVNDDQKKQVEQIVENNRQKLEENQSKYSDLAKELRKTADSVKQAELRAAQEQLRQSFKSTPLPTDIRSAEFYTISDVGSDYVGFERNGVETFHRLSSIHRIVRGVEIDEE
jgi:hypothetical protein